jgi:hypothetical protein
MVYSRAKLKNSGDKTSPSLRILDTETTRNVYLNGFYYMSFKQILIDQDDFMTTPNSILPF